MNPYSLLHGERDGGGGEGGGGVNALFLHCRNCDSLAVVVVAHFDPHLADHHLAAIVYIYKLLST